MLAKKKIISGRKARASHFSERAGKKGRGHGRKETGGKTFISRARLLSAGVAQGPQVWGQTHLDVTLVPAIP